MTTLREMQSSDRLGGQNAPRPLVTALGNALPAERLGSSAGLGVASVAPAAVPRRSSLKVDR